MLRILLSSLPLLAACSPAFAHPGFGEHGSFLAGFAHPISGLDHVLAMAAIGLWASMLGGRALWAMPAAFVGAMMGGFGMAVAGLNLPLIEPAILASVVVLGLSVAAAARLPVSVTAGTVASFAVFHGQAHGGEIGFASAGWYLVGFVSSTVLLHAIGVAALRSSAPSFRTKLARTLGAATAILGVGLTLGLG
jgi:urease accessory protein